MVDVDVGHSAEGVGAVIVLVAGAGAVVVVEAGVVVVVGASCCSHGSCPCWLVHGCKCSSLPLGLAAVKLQQ